MSMSPNKGDREYQKFVETSTGEAAVRVALATSLVDVSYDYIDLSYTGADLTGVVFKSGGSAGTVVATLTLAYSGGNLVSVTKS